MKDGIVYLRYKGEILKLKVSYDTKELKRIKKEMIEKCSTIKKVRDKREIFYEQRHDYDDTDHYKNLNIRVLSYPHRDEDREDVWCAGERSVSYDYYSYPAFAVQIDNVIRGAFGGIYGFMITFQEEVEMKTATEEITDSMQKILNDKSISEETRAARLGELSTKLTDITSGKVVYPSVHETSFNQRVLSTMNIEFIGKVEECLIDDFFSFFEFMNKRSDELVKMIIDYDSLDDILKMHLETVLVKLLQEDKKLKELKPDSN